MKKRKRIRKGFGRQGREEERESYRKNLDIKMEVMKTKKEERRKKKVKEEGRRH